MTLSYNVPRAERDVSKEFSAMRLSTIYAVQDGNSEIGITARGSKIRTEISCQKMDEKMTKLFRAEINKVWVALHFL